MHVQIDRQAPRPVEQPRADGLQIVGAADAPQDLAYLRDADPVPWDELETPVEALGCAHLKRVTLREQEKK